MGSTRALALALVAAAAASSGVARADDSYRAVIDRAELEPAAIGGQRLRVYLSAVAVQGQLLDVTEPKAIKAFVGTSELKAPYGVGTYGAAGGDTAIVFVVEATAAYADVLPVITDVLGSELLGSLSDKSTQIALLSYGDAVGTGKLAALKPARAKLAQLASDGSTDEPAMLETVERALALLKKEKMAREGRPLRELVVVIGDGRDRSADRERVIKVGKRAAADGVRIHALGYSPSDTRRPLLALGELSKRSLGTFRWVRGAKADSWTAAIQQLRDEVVRQNVLTFYLPDDADVAGKRLKLRMVGRTEAVSNEVTLPAAVGCGSATCDPGAYCAADHCVTPAERGAGDGVLGWIIKLVIGAVALLLALVGIGFALSKRAERRARGPAPITPPGAVPPTPGSVPPGGRAPAPTLGVGAAPPINAAAIAAAAAAAQAARPLAPAVLPNGQPAPVLFLLGGPRDGQRFPLRHGFTIGKAPTCDLVIDDGFTSSVHAQIGMDSFGNCRLYDNHSTNGLYVNGVRVAECALSHGVSVKIGATDMRFLTQ